MKISHGAQVCTTSTGTHTLIHAAFPAELLVPVHHQVLYRIDEKNLTY